MWNVLASAIGAESSAAGNTGLVEALEARLLLTALPIDADLTIRIPGEFVYDFCWTPEANQDAGDELEEGEVEPYPDEWYPEDDYQDGEYDEEYDHYESVLDPPPEADESFIGRVKEGEIEVFDFTVEAGKTYIFWTEAGTLEDTVLSVVSADGETELAFNDDANDMGFWSLITWTAQTSGTVRLEVAGFDETESGTYTLHATEAPEGWEDHGDYGGGESSYDEDYADEGEYEDEPDQYDAGYEEDEYADWEEMESDIVAGEYGCHVIYMMSASDAGGVYARDVVEKDADAAGEDAPEDPDMPDSPADEAAVVTSTARTSVFSALPDSIADELFGDDAVLGQEASLF